MTIEKALKIIKKYQKWRTGDERVKQQNSKVITEALNSLINFADNHKDLVTSFAEQTKIKKKI